MEKIVTKEAGLRVQSQTSYSTSPHGGQMESLERKRRGLELRAELSIPPVNTPSPGGRMESL